MKRRDLLREPIRHLDLNEINDFKGLLEAFNYTSYQSRSLARCYHVYRAMLQDKERVTVFMGLSGAMVPAGMRKIIADMMERGFIDVLVSTGANLYHDYAESFGSTHFVGSPKADDSLLRELSIDRIYDTYADEAKFVKLDHHLAEFFESFEPRSYSTREFCELIGKTLSDGGGILGAAARCGVPVFCPAINDSSLGISMTEYYRRMKEAHRPYATLDTIRDIYELAQIREKSPKSGVVFIGGGVPRNYIQQVEIVLEVLGRKKKRSGHDYAVQITTDDPKWGGLSGSTFEEAHSWGKIAKRAPKAVCYVDATIGLPLLAGALLHDRGFRNRKRLKFKWDGEELIGMD